MMATTPTGVCAGIYVVSRSSNAEKLAVSPFKYSFHESGAHNSIEAPVPTTTQVPGTFTPKNSLHSAGIVNRPFGETLISCDRADNNRMRRRVSSNRLGDMAVPSERQTVAISPPSRDSQASFAQSPNVPTRSLASTHAELSLSSCPT